MDMKSQERHASFESAATRALRTIEIQRHKRLEGMDNPLQDQQRKLFDLLDQLSEMIFTGIENAVRENQRGFMLRVRPHNTNVISTA